MKLKYSVICFCIILLSLIAEAQVSINTTNGLGVFHVDTWGNNAASGMPIAEQMSDDVVIDANTNTGVNMSIGGKVAPNSSAQLTLLDANKAILLNRVALTDLRDVVTIPNPQAGMLVYNTATSGTFPDNIVPGFYYFNGVVWYKWQYGEMNSVLSQNDLLTNCISSPVPGLNDPSSLMLASLADFGIIKISEKGTYIFAFRLYGTGTLNAAGAAPAAFSRTENYLFLMKNGSTKIAGIPINVLNPRVGTASAYTYTTVMQAVLDKDDIVTLRLGHSQGYYGWNWIASPGNNANKTSLIYWKI